MHCKEWVEYTSQSGREFRSVKQYTNCDSSHKYTVRLNRKTRICTIQTLGICSWSRCQTLPHLATTHLTPSLASFTFNLTQNILVYPPKASSPPLSGCYGCLTRSPVCSSCCDQRGSHFHRRFICQPSQQVGGGTQHVLLEYGKVVYLLHKITLQHRSVILCLNKQCHTYTCKLSMYNFTWKRLTQVLLK